MAGSFSDATAILRAQGLCAIPRISRVVALRCQLLHARLHVRQVIENFERLLLMFIKKYSFQYAGVEYANECYCDNSLQSGGILTSKGCDMTCAGNSSEYCGGPNRLDLYQTSATTSSSAVPSGWSSVGCFVDNVSARILTNSEGVQGGYTNMTIENCLGACKNAGYNLAGLEYAQECYCGNQLENGGICASD